MCTDHVLVATKIYLLLIEVAQVEETLIYLGPQKEAQAPSGVFFRLLLVSGQYSICGIEDLRGRNHTQSIQHSPKLYFDEQYLISSPHALGSVSFQPSSAMNKNTNESNVHRIDQ